MTPTLADHLLILCFVVLLPLRGAFSRPGLLAGVRGSASRLVFYRQTIALHGLMIACAVLVCVWSGHAWAVLGVTVTAIEPLMIGLIAAAGGLALHVWQGRRALVSDADIDNNIRRLGRMQSLLPQTVGERRSFYLLSVVAATSEEILFRAFLLHYLISAMSFWPAATLAVTAFALAHGYQGIKGVLQTGVIGAVLMAMYVWTGSIWPCVLFHAGFNAISGEIGGRLLNARNRRELLAADEMLRGQARS